METTKEEREWLRANWNAGGKGFRQWVAGSVRAHDLVPRAFRDVDMLEEALRRDICPGHVEVPPPETLCEFGATHCNKARAAL